ncbi:hypothetical protein [Nocardioides sp.]|uniref:hypothetical protein n=1 Tax=Nocardioides sp. TaxID=35761 RepID=UPI003563F5E5
MNETLGPHDDTATTLPGLSASELWMLAWSALVIGVLAWWRMAHLLRDGSAWTGETGAWLAVAVLMSIGAGTAAVLCGVKGVEERLRATSTPQL